MEILGNSNEQRAEAVLHELTADARRLVARGLMLAPPDGGRAWLQVLDEPDVNAWLIVWSAGASTGMHDHGGSAGIVRVPRGALVEQYTTPRFSRARLRRMYAGSTTAFGAGDRHDVQNVYRDEAVSLHVYAPRLERMDFFPSRPGELLFTPPWPESRVRA